MDQDAPLTRSKVDRYLKSLELAVSSLADVAAWRETHAPSGTETDGELADRLSFQDEWWDQIDRLDTLCDAYTRMELSEPQAARFATLSVRVLDALPLIQRLELRGPTQATIEIVRHLAQRGAVAKGA